MYSLSNLNSGALTWVEINWCTKTFQPPKIRYDIVTIPLMSFWPWFECLYVYIECLYNPNDLQSLFRTLESTCY